MLVININIWIINCYYAIAIFNNFICILCKRFIVQSGITQCVLKKDENSPIVYVSVEDIRKELENQR